MVLKKTLESPLDCKEIQPVHPKRSVLGVHWKDWCWSWNSNTLATSCKELTHWKRPWCSEGLGAGGEGDDRGWDGWMASPIQWTWVWVDSGSWWWTGRPGVLRFMGSKESDTTERLNWTCYKIDACHLYQVDIYIYTKHHAQLAQAVHCTKESSMGTSGAWNPAEALLTAVRLRKELHPHLEKGLIFPNSLKGDS